MAMVGAVWDWLKMLGNTSGFLEVLQVLGASCYIVANLLFDLLLPINKLMNKNVQGWIGAQWPRQKWVARQTFPSLGLSGKRWFICSQDADVVLLLGHEPALHIHLRQVFFLELQGQKK